MKKIIERVRDESGGYDAVDSAFNYGTLAPPPPPLSPQRSGSIRDNILGSRTSFNELLSAIPGTTAGFVLEGQGS